jgi:hypothetical protein
MAYLIEQKVGRHIYVYEEEIFRRGVSFTARPDGNENGRRVFMPRACVGIGASEIEFDFSRR